MSGGSQDAPRTLARPAQRFPARGLASHWALALLLAGAAAPLAAQDDGPAPPADAAATTHSRRAIDFEATQLSYDNETDTVTASGHVILRSEDRSVRADAVSWDRTTGRIIATGNIGCATQIAMHAELPIIHTIELLDWAYGGPTPEALADRFARGQS